MDKSNDAYKTIGEVVKILKLKSNKKGVLPTHTIRFWETQFKQIKPKILTDDNQLKSEEIKKALQESNLNNSYEPLYNDQKNIKIVQEAMFSSTNELYGTSYKSRIEDPKYQFAGKTGTSQVKRISKRERELD